MQVEFQQIEAKGRRENEKSNPCSKIHFCSSSKFKVKEITFEFAIIVKCNQVIMEQNDNNYLSTTLEKL